jgi:DNA polymerase I-like protein with 3'-5' exonuclease and polymerase domains
MATDLINGVFGAYKDLRAKMDEQLKFARRAGYAYIPWGSPDSPARIRPLPMIGSPDAKRRINAENASINSVIQGWAADFCTASVVELTNIFEHDFGGRAQVALSIHDAIVVECDDAVVQNVVDTMREVMTSWPSDPLKLSVEFEVGKSLGSMKPVN